MRSRFNFTGRVIPEKFVPPQPTDRPQALFQVAGARPRPSHPDLSLSARFIRTDNNRQLLIYTDGARSENGSAEARGDCAFVYKNCSQFPTSGLVSLPLGMRGPTGEIHQHTSNRAELRAVILA
jgi:ribonuclease HI